MFKLLFPFFLAVIFLECKQNKKLRDDFLDLNLTQVINGKKYYYYADGRIERIANINSKMEREGPETTYFHEPQGLINTICTRKSDSAVINEYYTYSLIGDLVKYEFFDGCGRLKFSRLYVGEDFSDVGDIFAHYTLKYPNKFKVGEIINKVYYITTPPKMSHQLFLISNKGRILLKNNSKVNYIQDVNYYNITKKRGYLSIKYQIELYDSLTNTKTSSELFHYEFTVE